MVGGGHIVTRRKNYQMHELCMLIASNEHCTSLLLVGGSVGSSSRGGLRAATLSYVRKNYASDNTL